MDIEQVREALIEWETLSANKENKAIYGVRAKELRDLLSNLEGKRREGLEEGLKKVALKLLKDDIEVEQVAKYVELPVEEIRQLKNSIK